MHHVQGEAERVTAASLVDVLREVHRDKLTLRQRHVAVARLVDQYAANNAYQNVISREDVHLSWLEAAIAELGGVPDSVSEPELPPKGRKESFAPLVSEDASQTEAFATKWRARIDEIGNARHRTMVNVIIGETLEHRRFFLQIGAGREDVLGRRSNGPGKDGTGDGVLPVRWIE